MKNAINSFVKRYGSIIMACAFAFVVFGANIPCITVFYEPEEPKGLENFKHHAS